MLQTIRDKTQGIVATCIVGLVALTFAIWGIHYYLEESKSTTVVIQVNSTKLTQDNFDRILRREQRLLSLARPDTQMSDAIQQKIQKMAIDQWVQTTVLTEAAKSTGFIVSAQMLQQTLANLDMFQQQGQFSPTLYQQRLEYMGYSPEEFQKNLQNELLIDQARYGLSKSDFLLPNELQQMIGTLYQTRDIGYVLIPQKSFLNSVVITPVEIKSYYAAHQQDFMDPEKVKIEYLQIKPEDLRQQITVSDADIKAFYQEHPDLQSKPLPQVKNSIKERLQNQNADKLMASLSDQLDSLSYEDPTSLQPVSQKLHIPTQVSAWLTKQDTSTKAPFPSAVIQAAFSNDVLQQGYNSSLLTLNDGSVMVLRLKAREASAVKPLATVQDQIKAILTAEEAKKAAVVKGESLLKALQQGQDPKVLAQKNGLVWQDAFNAARTSAGLNPELLVALFNVPLDHPAKQSILSGQALSDGDYLLLQIKAVHAGVGSRLTNKDKTQLTQQWAESLGQIDYAFYNRSLRDQAKIKIKMPKEVQS
jgi:peptidyl-prolyl cis-trans isomerase D